MKKTRFIDRPTDLPERQVDGSPLKSLPQILRDRRATPHFRSEPIPVEYLDAILALAGQAPSGYNLQPWRFVVVRDPEHRKELKAAAMDQAKVAEAPVVVVAYAQPDGWRTHMEAIFKEGARRGAGDPAEIEETMETVTGFLGGFPIEVWLNRHVMIAVTTLMLAAEAYGIDTAPMEGFEAEAVKKVCELPHDAEVVALLALGFAQEPDKAYGGRLAPEEFIRDEVHGQPWLPFD